MKILLGYVDSPEGEAALRTAVDEARLRDAELVIVSHLRVSGVSEQGREAAAARDALESLEAGIREQGVACRTHWSIGMESVASALLSHAKDEGAGLIVLGIRRRSPVGKLVLGSNAQDILLRADCPVLAVKAPGES
jgi:nucleotide-binding universal stress UspA family protein